jgi:ABC-2 family transporter protein
MASLLRILTIARTTLTEALRQKVLLILLLFGLIAIPCSFLFAELTLEEEFKFIKDFCTGAMSIFGMLIAIIGTAQLLPTEFENRTVYTILAKPVRRSEFLLGKFGGVLALVALTLVLMSGVFAGVLSYTEQRMIRVELAAVNPEVPESVAAGQAAIEKIRRQAWDPRLLQASALIFAKLALIAGLALLISTFATSMIFTVATTFLVVVIGNLQGIARDVWLGGDQSVGESTRVFLGVLSLLIPDFSVYNVIDEIVAGNQVPWSFTANVLGYSFIYLTVCLVLSATIFGEKEL